MQILELTQIIPFGTALLVPGYVGWSAANVIAPNATRSASDRVMGYALYSLVYFACFGLFYSDWVQNLLVTELSWGLVLGLVLRAASMLPFVYVAGLCSGALRRADIVCRVLRWIGVPANGWTDSAWLSAFSCRDSRLVRVVLRSGEVVWGHFGTRSLASAELTSGDVYLERECCINNDGAIVPQIGSRGIWLPRSEIVSISLYDFEDLDKYEQATEGKRQPARVPADSWKVHSAKADISRRDLSAKGIKAGQSSA